MTTEENRLIEQLRATLGRMESALDVVSDAIVWTGNGRIRWCNAAFTGLAGQPRLKLLGGRMNELLPLLSSGGIISPELHPASSAAPRGSGVYEFRSHSGELALEITWAGPESADESVMRIICLRDITVRVRYESVLKEKERRFRRFLEFAPDGILVVDADGQIIFSNRNLGRIFGYDSGELNGETVELLVPEKLRRGHASHRAGYGEAPAYRLMAPGRADIFGRHRDGRNIPVSVSLSPLHDKVSPGAIATVRDETEQRKMRAELEEKDAQLRQALKMEALGRLAGGIAHDFNNILTVILGYCSLSSAGAENRQADISEIADAATRAAGLTRQLLAFSRKQTLAPKVMDLNEAVSGMASLLRHAIGWQVRLNVRLHNGLGRIKADRNQIEQVLLNLSINARDAMPGGGELTISTANARVEAAAAPADVPAGDYASITFADTGCGMGEETRKRIFEPFFTTKGAGRGTGLGLASVFGIVSQSGGYISVDSSPGKGTSFRLYFPVTAEPPGPAEDRPVPRGAMGGAGGTVLIAEDDEAVMDVLSRTLILGGYRVKTATTGAEALRVFGNSPDRITLVVIDVKLPELEGKALGLRLRQIRPRAALLYISGFCDGVEIQSDARTAFLQKPIIPGEFLSVVRSLADSAGPGR